MHKEKFIRRHFNVKGHEITGGKYVLTPILQEDESFSFWLARKGYTVAMYCFTIGHGGISYKEQISEIAQYIRMYNDRYVKNQTE